MIELKEDQLNALIEQQSTELNAQYDKDVKALTDKLARDKKKLRAKVKQHYEQLLNKTAPDKKKRKVKTHVWNDEERAELKTLKDKGMKPSAIAEEFLKGKKDKTLTTARVKNIIRNLPA